MSNMTKPASSETNYKTPGSVFSQLRHLASELESGVEKLQQELNSNRQSSCSDTKHTLATKFLLHTKKDILHLKDEAMVKVAEFSRENAKFDRVHDLMKDVLSLQSQRLENVECYLEKYGYKRPTFVSDTREKNDVAENSDSARDSESSDVNHVGNEAEENDISISSELNDCDQNESPKVPSSQTASEIPANSNIMRTPRLEDLLKDLSEETILHIKRGARNKWQDNSENQNTATKDSTFSLDSLTAHTAPSFDDKNLLEKGRPEPPKLLAGAFTLNKFETSELNSQKVGVSKTDTGVCGTPEMPKLITPGFENIFKRGIMEEKTFSLDTVRSSSMRNKITATPRTPEPPVLLTGLFTFNNLTQQYEPSKSNFVHPTTPETPELLTPGFKFNIRGEVPDTSTSRVRVAATVKTPEAPTLLMSGFGQNNSVVNPAEREGVGRSVRSLFNTPPVPELKSCVFQRNNVVSTNSKNPLSPQSAGMYTPEVPKLLSLGREFNLHYHK